jgi:hypothetical protein
MTTENVNTQDAATEAVKSSPLLGRFYSLTPDQLINMCYVTNGWGWPEELADIKPERWDQMSQTEKYENRLFRDLYDTIKQAVSPWAVSWNHWKRNGLGTPEDHNEWWTDQDAYYRRKNPEMYKKAEERKPWWERFFS